MSDGNFNRQLLPKNELSAGLRAGKAQMRTRAEQAFAEVIKEAFPTLSDEERKIIIFGLSGVVGEKDAELRKLKSSSEKALKRLEEAQRDYKEMKEREDKLSEDIEEIEKLIDRINGSPEEKVLSTDEHLWDIMANNKQ